MKPVDQTVFHKAVDSHQKTIERLLVGSPSLLAITGISSAGTRISWHAIGEPSVPLFEAADTMARNRLNGDGFGIGVCGPATNVCDQIANLVHGTIKTLVDDKVLETN